MEKWRFAAMLSVQWVALSAAILQGHRKKMKKCRLFIRYICSALKIYAKLFIPVPILQSIFQHRGVATFSFTVVFLVDEFSCFRLTESVLGSFITNDFTFESLS